MIRARIDFESMELVIDGHAGGERNPEGHDLVCAAVSTLAYALAATMEEQNRYGKLRELMHEEKEGYSYLRAAAKTEEWGQVMARFETVVDGLRLVSEQYPECLKLQFE